MKNFLVLLIFVISHASAAVGPLVIGKAIKVNGKATVLPVNKNKPLKLKAGANVTYDASIFVKDNSYATIKLNNNLSFVKIGKQSKVSIRYEADEKAYYVRVYVGYIKVLFKQSKKADRMVIVTNNSTAIATDAKFIAVANPIVQTSTVFNYKGNLMFEDLSVPEGKYSVLSKRARTPSAPVAISEHRKTGLGAIFNIEKKQKDKEMGF
jgi:hypothetical protein